MKINLHTHTARCGHACGTDEEYVLAAIEAGYDVLGFSDHTPFPYENGYHTDTKMTVDQLDGYVASVLSLKEKYRDKIQILLGLECESVPRFFPWLKEISRDMDYLILGNHGDWSIGEPYPGQVNDRASLEKYLQTTVDAMESGLFLYLAHPDLVLTAYATFDADAEWVSRQLCREANRCGLPVEYNLYGVLKGHGPKNLGYPCEKFWQIAAEENVRAVVGVDAHKPEHMLQDLGFYQRKLESMGITVLHDPRDAKKQVANPEIIG